jgi:hypothetical protein
MIRRQLHLRAPWHLEDELPFKLRREQHDALGAVGIEED